MQSDSPGFLWLPVHDIETSKTLGLLILGIQIIGVVEYTFKMEAKVLVHDHVVRFCPVSGCIFSLVFVPQVHKMMASVTTRV